MNSRDPGSLCPLVVIGAGAAGMAAAAEAARGGLPVVLFDECTQRPELRGDSALVRAAAGADCRLARELAELADRIDWRDGHAVLSVSTGREILWAARGVSGVVRAEQIILATGGSRRLVPFPGWTLPGVVAADDPAGFLARSASRALVAGSGADLLDAARRLVEAGVGVAAVLEAGRPPWAGGEAIDGWADTELAREVTISLERLRDASVPVLPGHAVFAARGPGRVASATYGAIDGEWRPLRDQCRTIDVDVVVTGFGRNARNELSVLAGCRQQLDRVRGGWVVARDASQQTSVAGISVAGDGAGVAGRLVAEDEGRLVGLAAAERAGALAAAEAAARRAGLLGRLAALAAARDGLDEAMRLRPGLFELWEDDTVLCRCEAVALADVRAAIDQGAGDLSTVKLLTRLGMGTCQGRECGSIAAMHLCRATGRTADQVGVVNPRPPVGPVTLGALARMEGVKASAAVDPRDAIGVAP